MRKRTVKFLAGAVTLGLLFHMNPLLANAQEEKRIQTEPQEVPMDAEMLFKDGTNLSEEQFFPSENSFVSEKSPQNTVQPVSETPGQEMPGKEQAGTIVITRGKMDKEVVSDSDFNMEIFLENTWKSRYINNGKLWVDLPEDFSMDPSHEKEKIDIPVIDPGETKKVIVKLHAGNLKGNTRTVKIPVNITYTFGAETGEVQKQQETILIPVSPLKTDTNSINPPISSGDEKPGKPEEIPADPGIYSNIDTSSDGMVTTAVSEKKKTDPMTPRIIVNQYQYGENIEDGKEFTVNLTFFNTNDTISVENIVVNMEPSEEVSLKNMTNVIYLKKLGPQASHNMEAKLKTAGNGKTDKAELTINFKYEYMKNRERTEGEASQKIVIPVKEAERFSVGDIQTGDEISQGEEFSVSLPYVNKGKSPVYNVEAYLETKMKTGETYKYIGNVEAGTSGTLDFFVTPETAGEQTVNIKLIYENSMGSQKTVEKKASFQAAELVEEMPEEWNDFTEEEPKSKGKKGIILGTAGAGTLAAGLLFRYIRKRKERQMEENEDEGFEE